MSESELKFAPFDENVAPGKNTLKVDGNENWSSIEDSSGYTRGIDHLQVFNGEGQFMFDKFRVKNAPGIFILPMRVTPDGHAEFLLISEWNILSQEYIPHIPQGGIKKDTELSAAKRELKEETGYEAQGFVRMGAQIFDSSYSTDKDPFFLAIVAYEQEAGDLDLDPTENIKKLSWMRWNDLRKLGIVDGKTTIALALAQNVLKDELLTE